MLFNSIDFLFFFLPIVLVAYYVIARAAFWWVNCIWLIGCSFYFYMYWDFNSVFILISSICINFLLAILITHSESQKKLLMVLGIIFNLGLLSYYKYFNFFIDNVNNLMGGNIEFHRIFLPIGISFFTFQQIAYLVDTRRDVVREHHFLRYVLFVSFFPQLIAGPIVHYQELTKQFSNLHARNRMQDFAVGLSIFAIGLFKKVMIADTFAQSSSPVFDSLAQGNVPNIAESWVAALSYSLQIYFDFSAYSDMAIGLARMFGVTLPVNFSSPYKAASIIEFWRRWHITLSRFLRDYLYFAFGGNRKGPQRTLIHVFLTMLIGGFWHGAGWTFVVWGAIHGGYLVCNHLWRRHFALSFPKPLSCLLTIFCVVIAWVFFRSDNMTHALTLLISMFGGNGLELTQTVIEVSVKNTLPLLALGWLCVFFAPNTQQIMKNYTPALKSEGYVFIEHYRFQFIQWKPTLRFAVLIGFLLGFSILGWGHVSEFIYFQF